MPKMLFKNRQQAAEKLAKELVKLKIRDGVVVGLTRGGVVVAFQLAKKLNLPFDFCVVKKLGAPNQAELAVGAITSTGKPYLDKDLIERLGVHKDYLTSEIDRKRSDAKKLENIFNQAKPAINIKNKSVILTDDGIATGASIFAAVAYLNTQKPKKIILAVPIAPPSTLEKLKDKVDDMVVLTKEEEFRAVGQFYKDFGQVEDIDVLEILNLNK